MAILGLGGLCIYYVKILNVINMFGVVQIKTLQIKYFLCYIDSIGLDVYFVFIEYSFKRIRNPCQRGITGMYRYIL